MVVGALVVVVGALVVVVGAAVVVVGAAVVVVGACVVVVGALVVVEGDSEDSSFAGVFSVFCSCSVISSVFSALVLAGVLSSQEAKERSMAKTSRNAKIRFISVLQLSNVGFCHPHSTPIPTKCQ